MNSLPLPPGYRSITPYLTNDSLTALLEFVTAAFGAEIHERLEAPDGSIVHAEVKVGDSMIMAGAAREQWPAMPGALYLYCDDVDAVYARALAAGATSIHGPMDQFYGDRSAGVKDQQGNVWWIATHVEDVPPDELKQRAAKMFEG